MSNRYSSVTATNCNCDQQINAGRLYWVDGSAAAMGADSFDIYKNPSGPTGASLFASSVTRSAAQCTAIPGNPAAAQCSYALAGSAGLASGYSFYFSVVAKNCMAGGTAVSSSSSDTDSYYTAARRRLQHSNDVSSDVSCDVAHHVAGHLSRACDACNDYAAAVGGAAVPYSDSSSSSSTGRQLQQADNETVSSNNTGPVGLPPLGWVAPRVLSACEKAGGDPARLSDGTCDSWMNTKACKYDGESQLLLN
jgi:hypothetical protein